jgi:hypothetical protein
MPASFSMIASSAAPYSNQRKEIAAYFALTARLNARQSNNINPVAPDRIKNIRQNELSNVLIDPIFKCYLVSKNKFH